MFRRVASGDLLDTPSVKPASASTAAARYVQLVAIDADGELTLSPTGQPTYRLAPYRERVFAIRELEGYRVEFVADESGAVTNIIFHQPNGTFQAQRETE